MELRRRRADRRTLFYNSLINKNKKKQIKEDIVNDEVKVSRVPFIKIIDENNKRRNEQIIKTQIDRKRAIEEDQKDEPEKNPNELLDNTFDSLKTGIHDAKDKEDYIHTNRDNFKKLETVNQRILFKIFLDIISV